MLIKGHEKTIVLVFPPASINDVGIAGAFVPNGILLLAKQLLNERKDINVIILDGSVIGLNEIINRLATISPDIVCLSALAGNYKAGKKVLQKSKELGAVTILGNHHANYLWSVLPLLDKDKTSFIDFIITGNHDGDVLVPLIELLDHGDLSHLHKLPNLCFKNNGEWLYPKHIDYKEQHEFVKVFSYIDDFRPYFKKYRETFANFHEEVNAINPININYFKGCAQGQVSPCIYCCLKDYSCTAYVEPDRFWVEIQQYVEQGFNYFFEAANSFTFLKNMKAKNGNNYLAELAGGMPNWARETCSFMIYARADELDKQTVETLKRMNVHRIILGFDASNETILSKGLGKNNITTGMNYEVASLLNEYGIQIYACYVPGAIGETHDSLRWTKDEIRNIMELDNCCTIEYTSLAPMPGSKAWEFIKTDYFKARGFVDVLGVEDISKFWLSKMVKAISWDDVQMVKEELSAVAQEKNIIFGGYY